MGYLEFVIGDDGEGKFGRIYPVTMDDWEVQHPKNGWIGTVEYVEEDIKRFCFLPCEDAVISQGTLLEIADFIEKQNMRL